MIYINQDLQESMIAALKNKEMAIVNKIVQAVETGYSADKNNRINILSWTSILIDTYENINVYTEEEQDKIDRLYNKVMSL